MKIIVRFLLIFNFLLMFNSCQTAEHYEQTKSPEDSKLKVVARDHNFIAYATGVVYDRDTGLEWYVGPDRDTTWEEAKSWVLNLKVAGGDWRMPTKNELKTLYRKGVGTRNTTPLLRTTGWWVWSAETRESWGGDFSFYDGDVGWASWVSNHDGRGFAVRSRK